ncbi:RmlC-like cupin family protein [Tieghemostelium lacteum]|uniref:RmlC-like cupin family protein n=1 Tax=Tieghemostelium lacteum TaxID=361077 RepID=A0A151ZJV6_TIELA|nr:RmlC-like cupin family protein [Tieghemostelium lacteum]|eukprot:KYQ94207.1 RmlC-like cupin family protein [Tieghemostelium lacteum]
MEKFQRILKNSNYSYDNFIRLLDSNESLQIKCEKITSLLSEFTEVFINSESNGIESHCSVLYKHPTLRHYILNQLTLVFINNLIVDKSWMKDYKKTTKSSTQKMKSTSPPTIQPHNKKRNYSDLYTIDQTPSPIHSPYHQKHSNSDNESTNKFLERQCIIIHEFLISNLLAKKNSPFWYPILEQWILKTLELSIKIILLNSNNSNNNNNISQIFEESLVNNQTLSLEFSILFHIIQKVSIEKFIQGKFKLLEKGGELQSAKENVVVDCDFWILCYIGIRYPNFILKLIFRHLLESIGKSNENRFINLFDFLMKQSQEVSTEIIENYLESQEYTMDDIIKLIKIATSNQYLTSMILPILFQYFTIHRLQSINSSSFSSSLLPLTTIIQNNLLNNDFINFNYSTEIIRLLRQCMECDNKQFQEISKSLFQELIFHFQRLYLKSFSTSSSDQEIPRFNFKSFNKILVESLDNQSQNQSIVDLSVLSTLYNGGNLELAIEILRLFIVNQKMNTPEFSWFTLIFQKQYPSVIDMVISKTLSEIGGHTVENEQQVLTILNSLYLYSIHEFHNNNDIEIQYKLFKSMVGQWPRLLKLIENPSNQIVSKISLDLLYHSFVHSIDDSKSLMESLDIRILLEKILKLYFIHLKSSLESKVTLYKLKHLYLKILINEFTLEINFKFTLNLIFDYIFSMETCLILKPIMPYLIAPSNTLLSPMFNYSNYEYHYNNEQQQKKSNIITIQKSSYQQQQHNEQVMEPVNNGEESMDMVITNYESMFEVNYLKKHYQYRVKDMNNPKHLPFKNIKSIQKKSTPKQQMEHLQEEYQHYQLNENELVEFIRDMITVQGYSNSNMIDMLLDELYERLNSQYPIPTWEYYQETLPKPSTWDRDLFIRKIFQQNPILWKILLLISELAPDRLSRCLEIIKSLLVNEISYWASEKFIKETPKSSHYQSTCDLITILLNSEFIFKPLSMSLEIIDRVSPEEVSYILHGIFNFIKDYQPTTSQYQPKLLKRSYPAHLDMDIYSVPLKSIFHKHMNEFCFLYGRFFSPKI